MPRPHNYTLFPARQRRATKYVAEAISPTALQGPPSLQKLVEDYGGYPNITPAAWQRFDEQMKAWKACVRYGEAKPAPAISAPPEIDTAETPAKPALAQSNTGKPETPEAAVRRKDWHRREQEILQRRDALPKGVSRLTMIPLNSGAAS